MFIRRQNPTSFSTALFPLIAITLTSCGSDSSDSGDNSNGDDDNQSSLVVLHDEASDGDITDDPNNPLPLQLAAGSRQLSASVVAPDLDYITINVPAGTELTAITLDSYESASAQSFIAIQNGSVFTELASSPNVANLLGYAHFGTFGVDTDLLPAIAASAGAQGFTPPLPAGDYSLWIQETGSSNVDFSITFETTATGG